MPTRDELLVLADHFEERGDPRADIARRILDPNSVKALLRLLAERDQHEAACVFAEHALVRERYSGREPDPNRRSSQTSDGSVIRRIGKNHSGGRRVTHPRGD